MIMLFPSLPAYATYFKMGTNSDLPKSSIYLFLYSPLHPIRLLIFIHLLLSPAASYFSLHLCLSHATICFAALHLTFFLVFLLNLKKWVIQGPLFYLHYFIYIHIHFDNDAYILNCTTYVTCSFYYRLIWCPKEDNMAWLSSSSVLVDCLFYPFALVLYKSFRQHWTNCLVAHYKLWKFNYIFFINILMRQPIKIVIFDWSFFISRV